MINLVTLEFRKLFGSRSTQVALVVSFLLPLLWAVSPRLGELMNVEIVSGWQVPAVSIDVAVQSLLPLFVALAVAELVGTEVAQGTLAPVLLRPVGRLQVIASKLIAALCYPFALVIVTLVGALIAGVFHGYGAFLGGTGFSGDDFVGVGMMQPGTALIEVLRGSFMTAYMLMPIAALALLYGVTLLNTAAAALATVATVSVIRLMVVLPDFLQTVLLTNYLALYRQDENIPIAMFLLLVYTLGFGGMAIYAFERRDV